MNLRQRLTATAAPLFALLVGFAWSAEPDRTGGPYVPTPQAVVDAMLQVAEVKQSDFVVDLGSGDGRIVLTAAQRYQARGLGIEIDPELVERSNAEAQRRGLGERVQFREQDVLKARIEDATVVTLYLLPGMMQQLQTKFARELKPGTRIVSHDFPFGDWKPDREVSVDVPEKYGSPGQWKSTVFLWVVPARVEGTWQLHVPQLPLKAAALALEQRYQHATGAIMDDGRRLPISEARLEADRIRFRVTLPSGPYEFRGVVENGRMRGEATGGRQPVAWSAVRQSAAGAAAH